MGHGYSSAGTTKPIIGFASQRKKEIAIRNWDFALMLIPFTIALRSTLTTLQCCLFFILTIVFHQALHWLFGSKTKAQLGKAANVDKKLDDSLNSVRKQRAASECSG